MLDPEKGFLCDICYTEGKEVSGHTRCMRCGCAICYNHSVQAKGKISKYRVNGFPNVSWLPIFAGRTIGDIIGFLPLIDQRRVQSDPNLAAQPAERMQIFVDGYVGWLCIECKEVANDVLDAEGQPVVVASG